MLKNCTSDANVSEQQDEMEAITAIYSEQDIRIIRPAPVNTSFPSACFSIALTNPSPDLQGIPPSWDGQISLTLDFPSDYPNGGTLLRSTIELGVLSMMDFPSAFKKSLHSVIVRALSYCNDQFSYGCSLRTMISSLIARLQGCHACHRYIPSLLQSLL